MLKHDINILVLFKVNNEDISDGKLYKPLNIVGKLSILDVCGVLAVFAFFVLY